MSNKHWRQDLRKLYDLCHDYGTVVYGEFPDWRQVTKAGNAGRLTTCSYDSMNAGMIRIKGENKCEVIYVLDHETAI